MCPSIRTSSPYSAWGRNWTVESWFGACTVCMRDPSLSGCQLWNLHLSSIQYEYSMYPRLFFLSIFLFFGFEPRAPKNGEISVSCTSADMLIFQVILTSRTFGIVHYFSRRNGCVSGLKLGKELNWKRIPHKYGNICVEFFLTPSPTSVPIPFFFLAHTSSWGKCVQYAETC